MYSRVLSLFLLLIVVSAECSRILFLHPSFSKSHVIPLQILAKALAKRGHEVTFVSQFPFDKPISNFRDIKVTMSEEYKIAYDYIGKQMSGSSNIFQMIPTLKKLIIGHGNETLQSEPVQQLMREGEFDLLVTGYFFNEFNLGLADHFNCPSIVFCPGGYLVSLHKMVGNPLSPEGTKTAIFGSDETGLISRMKNFIAYGFEMTIQNIMFRSDVRKVYK